MTPNVLTELHLFQSYTQILVLIESKYEILDYFSGLVILVYFILNNIPFRIILIYQPSGRRRPKRMYFYHLCTNQLMYSRHDS